MNLKDVNERYHQKSRIQKRVINSKNFTYRLLISALGRNIKCGMKILDLGSGVGTLDFYFANKGCSAVGVDFSGVAVSIARKNAEILDLSENINYIHKNIQKFKSNKKWDAVFLFEVIEHLPDDQKVLIQAKKMLKKNGLLCLSTRSANSPLFKLHFVKRYEEYIGHLRRYSPEELEKILKRIGLKIIVRKKEEGILREALFFYPVVGSPIVRIANKVPIFSDILTLVDRVLLRMLGESQLIFVARKI